MHNMKCEYNVMGKAATLSILFRSTLVDLTLNITRSICHSLNTHTTHHQAHTKLEDLLNYNTRVLL